MDTELKDLWIKIYRSGEISTRIEFISVSEIEELADLLLSVEKPCKEIIGILAGRTGFEIIGRDLCEELRSKGCKIRCEVVHRDLDYRSVESLVKDLRSMGARMIIGIGGGFINDLAKYIGSRISARVTLIPTTISTNSLVSPFSVFREGDRINAYASSQPDLLLIDPELISKAPRRHIAAGYADTLAKYTALYDWRLARWFSDTYYSKDLDRIASKALRILMRESKYISRLEKSSVEELLYSQLIDGYLMQKASTTRVVAGSEHLIALALTILSREGLHGEYVSLGIIIASYIQQRSWRRVRSLLTTIGAPTNIHDIGIDRETMIKAMIMAPNMRNWYTILGRLDEKKAEELLASCEII